VIIFVRVSNAKSILVELENYEVPPCFHFQPSELFWTVYSSLPWRIHFLRDRLYLKMCKHFLLKTKIITFVVSINIGRSSFGRKGETRI
jgi:hypothetical protein